MRLLLLLLFCPLARCAVSSTPTEFPTRRGHQPPPSGPLFASLLIPRQPADSSSSIWTRMQAAVRARLPAEMDGEVEIAVCGSPTKSRRGGGGGGEGSRDAERDDLPPLPTITHGKCSLYRNIVNVDRFNPAELNIRVDLLLSVPRVALDGALDRIREGIDEVLHDLQSGRGEILQLNPPPLSTGPKKPNILLLLADDMGYGDVGYQACSAAKAAPDCPCSSPEMTPTLDRLARSASTGTFSRFYSHSQCTPEPGGNLHRVRDVAGLGCCQTPARILTKWDDTINPRKKR